MPILEDWVRYESEGYQDGVEVPPYRRIPVSYKGTFLGPVGMALNNMPIPGYLIAKYCGPDWVSFPFARA